MWKHLETQNRQYILKPLTSVLEWTLQVLIL